MLAWVGVSALLGLGVLVWQRQKPSLTIEGKAIRSQAAQWDAALSASRQIDVNTADAAELERLPGVGPSLARRIVEYRQAHGRFSSPEELSRVPGLGPKTSATLHDYVTTERE